MTPLTIQATMLSLIASSAQSEPLLRPVLTLAPRVGLESTARNQEFAWTVPVEDFRRRAEEI